MIEYVYYDTWFMWEPGGILFAIFLSTAVYLILTSAEVDGQLKFKPSRPRWIASIPSVASIVYLGVYCIIPIITYLAISYWIDKLRVKQVNK